MVAPDCGMRSTTSAGRSKYIVGNFRSILNAYKRSTLRYGSADNKQEQ